MTIYSLLDGSDGTIMCSLGGSAPAPFLIDSGAEINVVSEGYWRSLKAEYNSGSIALFKISTASSKRIMAYAGKDPLTILNTFEACVHIADDQDRREHAKFFVIRAGRKSLLGRSTALKLGVLRLGINNVTVAPVDQPLKLFPCIPGEVADFSIDESVPQTKNAYYHVPAAFAQRARNRIKEMEMQGIIERVNSAPKWISGMSAVPKGKTDFRLVVNMRGPNKAIRRQYYRLPLLEEIQTKLHGSTWFTKLDLSNAFYHVMLSERSQELTTFMTETGMFRFTRLVFGVNCAPEIFQRVMETVLRDISRVVVFIDDILVYASSIEELKSETQKVMAALNKNNLSLNTSKCEHEKRELTFLGHSVSADGLAIDKAKTESVHKFQEPKTMSELKSFLGLASYVSTYIPRFADKTEDLWKATRGDFQWGDDQRRAFREVKKAIIECTIKKGFFSNTDQTILYTDASLHALGAVLVQVDSKGTPRIISFASKSLTKTERAYPQTQREALGIVWAVEHFFYFLMGRSFIIRTDAQGMTFIINRERETSKRVISRAEGWFLRLEAYSYKVEYVKGLQNIADPSSRLYRGVDPEFDDTEKDGMISLVRQIEEDIEFGSEVLTQAEIAKETAEDVPLQEVLRSLHSGGKIGSRSYEKIKGSLTQEAGLLIKDGAVVIPHKLRAKALELAHKGHPGATAMKSILRSRVWWPGLSEDAVERVRSCRGCTLTARKEPPNPMVRSKLPSGPWQQIAVDYNGPYAKYGGITILAIVDTYSRYLLAIPISSTGFEPLKKALQQVFDIYGYPMAIKQDNGPPFNGQDYANFLTQLGIRREHSWPLCPQQNGMAERKMQTINKALAIASDEQKPFRIALEEAVRSHNAAKNRVTQWAPEELLMGRKIRRSLPLIGDGSIDKNEQELRQRDESEKEKSKVREDKRRRAREPTIVIGDTVVTLRSVKAKGDTNFDPTLYKVIGRRGGNFTMKSVEGKILKRHVTQLKKWNVRDEAGLDRTISGRQQDSPKQAHDETQPESDEPQRDGNDLQREERPVRQRVKPKKLADYVMKLDD